MAELVDALDLGSSGATCRGSSPLSRTTMTKWFEIMVRNGAELGMYLEIEKIIIRFSPHGDGPSRLRCIRVNQVLINFRVKFKCERG